MSKIILIATFILLAVNPVRADFICRAEITYKWTREGSITTIVNKTPSSATPESSAAGSSELSIFWAAVEHKGPTEDEAKAGLAKRTQLQRSAADKACSNQHENLVGCIASKYNSIAASLSGMSFSARKSMDEAIASDCKAQQGKCLGTTVSEVKCTEVVVQVSGTPEAGKDSKDKKDAKKK